MIWITHRSASGLPARIECSDCQAVWEIEDSALPRDVIYGLMDFGRCHLRRRVTVEAPPRLWYGGTAATAGAASPGSGGSPTYPAA